MPFVFYKPFTPHNNNRFYFIIATWKLLRCTLQVRGQCQVCDLICQCSLLYVAFCFLCWTSSVALLHTCTFTCRWECHGMSCMNDTTQRGDNMSHTVSRGFLFWRARAHTHELWLTCQSLGWKRNILPTKAYLHSEWKTDRCWRSGAPRIGLHGDMCALSPG